MEIASTTAAQVLVASHIVMTEANESATPNARAASGSMRPMGMGRRIVRRIFASISRSHHMFRQPAAPAATAMQRMAVKASTGCKWPGAIHRPMAPVNTTRLTTRGFSSFTQSRHSAVDWVRTVALAVTAVG